MFTVYYLYTTVSYLDTAVYFRQDSNTRLKSRVFPMMLSRNIPDKFSYESCSFKVQKTKV